MDTNLFLCCNSGRHSKLVTVTGVGGKRSYGSMGIWLMSRPPRPVFSGATYHITARGNNEESIFVDEADRYAYLTLLAKASRTMAVRLFGYALMTAHVHLALQTTLPNISAMIRRLHTCYAKQFNRRHGRINHLFGDRFYSKLISDD